MKPTPLLFLLLIAAPILFACRKGEDDPLLSLRTRRARIAGEWKLTAMESTSYYTNSGTTIDGILSYDGWTEAITNVTTDPSGDMSTNEYVQHYTVELVIRKDGTYTETRTTLYGQVTETVVKDGAWNFLGKSRKNGLRNKEAILLVQTAMTINGNTTSFSDITGTPYVISELRNRKMTWTIESLSTSSSGSQETRTQRTYTQQ